MRKLGAFAVAVACAAIVQGVALGAGPSPGLSQNGIASADVRYVAVTGDGTTLEVVRGDRVLRSKTVRGTWGIPLVSFDGTAGGLSADGRMLILSDTNGVNPQAKRTSFLAVATKTFHVLTAIRLKGSWSF